MKTIFKLETSSPADSHEAVLVPEQAPNSLLPAASPDARPGSGGLPNQEAMAGETHLPRLAYSVKETAEILHVSPKSIYRLTARGLLKPSKALRHLKFSVEEIRRFMRETTR